MLGHIRQDQIGRNRSDLVQARFAEFALDIVFAGKAEATVELQARIGGFPRRVSRQHLGHIGFGAARLMRIIEFAGAISHQIGCFEIDIRFRDRKLNPLILSNRPAENNTVFYVAADLVDEPETIACDTLCHTRVRNYRVVLMPQCA